MPRQRGSRGRGRGGGDGRVQNPTMPTQAGGRGRRPAQRGSVDARGGSVRGSQSRCQSRIRYPRQDQNARGATAWAPTPGLMTARRQVEIEEAQALSDIGFTYLNNPPADRSFPVTGYFMWTSDFTPQELMAEQLTQIRKSCQVYICFVAPRQCLQIDGDDTQNVEMALAKLRLAIEEVNAEGSPYTRLYIVDPPTAEAKRDHVSPKLRQLSKSSVPIVEKVMMAGPAMDVEAKSQWAIDRVRINTANKSLFLKTVGDAMEKIRSLSSEKRMRVLFGHMELHKYKKGFQDSYPYDEFVKMMGQSRTDATLRIGIGDLAFAATMLQKVNSETNMFRPVLRGASLEQKFEPTHLVVLRAKGPSHEKVRIESQIDHSFESKGMYQLGSSMYFRDQGSTVRLKVGMLCLERQQDWSLELTSYEPLSVVPKAFQALLDEVATGKNIEMIDQFGFSFPNITLKPSCGVISEGVQLRSTFRFWVQNTSYIIEFIIVREMSQVRFPISKAVCEVELYNPGWDFQLDASQTQIDLNESFPPENGSQDGVQDFLDVVKIVQNFLDTALE